MNELFHLINEMSPYLLLGFLLAGIMHAFVPTAMYKKYLGSKSWRSVLNATLLGIPLPLCSCGTIPTAMSLRKEGASKGATTAFLISTPQTGVDSIIATYSIMGLPFALLRPIVALFTALFGGLFVNHSDKGEGEDSSRDESEEVDKLTSRQDKQKNLVSKIKDALHYGFVEMMQDIGKWLMLGLVVAGAITVFVPEEFFSLFSDNSLLSMFIVLLFALPMYICATGSIPIAAALMLKGLSPGTALVLLIAGPAINMASMMVISKVMGKRTLFVYLLSIIGGAILFGLITDHILPREWFTEHINQIKSCCSHDDMFFNQLCTIVLVLLLANAFRLRNHHHKGKCGCGCGCHEGHDDDLTVRIEGMMCNHCKSNAEKALRSVSGVEDVSIDLASGKATIKGHANIEELRKAVEAIGFSMVN